jgi:GNAT acetyltransferase-like protein
MFSPDDAAWIQAVCDRPEMARFVPVLPSPYTLADAEGFVRYAQDAWEQGSSAPFAITTTEGEPLGAVEVHLNPRDASHAGVGYCSALKAVAEAQRRKPCGSSQHGPSIN